MDYQMITCVTSSYTFTGTVPTKKRGLKTLINALKSGFAVSSDKPRQIPVSGLKTKTAPIQDSFAQNAQSIAPDGRIKYLRNVDDVVIIGKEIDGNIDMAAGELNGSKAKSITSYGTAKVVNSSGIDGTYVGERASLKGGAHGYLNIQGEGKVSSVKAESAVLYGKGKLSNSTAKEFIEANDLAVLEDVKAPEIIMNGWFTRLKGKNNQCNNLKADMVWRILHLDFRKSIKPQ